MLGTYIREKRTKLKMSQSEFAEKLNATQSTIAKWENESVRVPPELLQEISKILKLQNSYSLWERYRNDIETNIILLKDDDIGKINILIDRIIEKFNERLKEKDEQEKGFLKVLINTIDYLCKNLEKIELLSYGEAFDLLSDDLMLSSQDCYSFNSLSYLCALEKHAIYKKDLDLYIKTKSIFDALSIWYRRVNSNEGNGKIKCEALDLLADELLCPLIDIKKVFDVKDNFKYINFYSYEYKSSLDILEKIAKVINKSNTRDEIFKTIRNTNSVYQDSYITISKRKEFIEILVCDYYSEKSKILFSQYLEYILYRLNELNFSFEFIRKIDELRFNDLDKKELLKLDIIKNLGLIKENFEIVYSDNCLRNVFSRLNSVIYY